jgi:hypothetical protein
MATNFSGWISPARLSIAVGGSDRSPNRALPHTVTLGAIL